MDEWKEKLKARFSVLSALRGGIWDLMLNDISDLLKEARIGQGAIAEKRFLEKQDGIEMLARIDENHRNIETFLTLSPPGTIFNGLQIQSILLKRIKQLREGK